MLNALLKSGETIARAQLERKVAAVAAQLRAIVGDAAVSVEDSRIAIRGRGIVKRWLTDPALRFVTGGLK